MSETAVVRVLLLSSLSQKNKQKSLITLEKCAPVVGTSFEMLEILHIDLRNFLVLKQHASKLISGQFEILLKCFKIFGNISEIKIWTVLE